MLIYRNALNGNIFRLTIVVVKWTGQRFAVTGLGTAADPLKSCFFCHSKFHDHGSLSSVFWELELMGINPSRAFSLHACNKK